MTSEGYLNEVQIEALARLKAYHKLPPIRDLQHRYGIDKVLLDKYRDDINLAAEKYRTQIYEQVVRYVQIGAKEGYITNILDISKATLYNYKKKAQDEGLLPITTRTGLNTRDVHAAKQRARSLRQGS